MFLFWHGLNQAANRLARAILGICDSMETPIALFLNHGTSLLTSIRALLKAGKFLETSVAPRTYTEKVLTDIWADTLGIDQLGIHENFLDLGGNSLLAMQVISKALTEFEIDVPLR